MSSLTSIGFHPNTFGGREYAVRESWVPDGDYDNDHEWPYLGDLCVLCESKKSRGRNEQFAQPVTLNF
ncbi:MAG: hypothetical protein JRJ60_15715 [Deltaproteobacteria bacterium]|nr:hypothetical protein [Deltaproteobacteria bacterium]